LGLDATGCSASITGLGFAPAGAVGSELVPGFVSGLVPGSAGAESGVEPDGEPDAAVAFEGFVKSRGE
jgi:hypothetical protein